MRQAAILTLSALLASAAPGSLFDIREKTPGVSLNYSGPEILSQREIDDLVHPVDKNILPQYTINGRVYFLFSIHEVPPSYLLKNYRVTKADNAELIDIHFSLRPFTVDVVRRLYVNAHSNPPVIVREHDAELSSLETVDVMDFTKQCLTAMKLLKENKREQTGLRDFQYAQKNLENLLIKKEMLSVLYE